MCFVKGVKGLEGIGEAYACGPDETVGATIHDFEEGLVGEDPRHIQFPFPGARRHRAGAWRHRGEVVGFGVCWAGSAATGFASIRGSAPTLKRLFGWGRSKGYTTFQPSPLDADRKPINAHPREAAQRLRRLRDALGTVASRERGRSRARSGEVAHSHRRRRDARYEVRLSRGARQRDSGSLPHQNRPSQPSTFTFPLQRKIPSSWSTFPTTNPSTRLGQRAFAPCGGPYSGARGSRPRRRAQRRGLREISCEAMASGLFL